MFAKERGARMKWLKMRRKLTYSTAARACLCTASSSTAFRAVSSVHLVLLSLKFRGCLCRCACLDGELAMSEDCDVEGGVDKEGVGMRGLYPLDTIRLGRQEMSHVDSCIRIRTWTM
jgi:hypothetical protein